LGAGSTGNILSFTAINTGLTVQVATITVTPTFTNGGSTCTGSTTSFTITVNPMPFADTGLASDILCAQEGSPYPIIGDTAINATSISWSSTGDGSFDFTNALHPTYSIGPTDVINSPVQLIMVASNSCGTDTSIISLSISEAPEVTITSNDTIVCEGSQVVLTATSFAPGSGPNYAWFYLPGTNLNNSTNVYTIPGAVPADSGVYEVQVTFSNGCPSTTDTINVTVNPTPATSPIYHGN